MLNSRVVVAEIIHTSSSVISVSACSCKLCLLVVADLQCLQLCAQNAEVFWAVKSCCFPFSSLSQTRILDGIKNNKKIVSSFVDICFLAHCKSCLSSIIFLLFLVNCHVSLLASSGNICALAGAYLPISDTILVFFTDPWFGLLGCLRQENFTVKMKQEKWLRRWSIRSMSSEKGKAKLPCSRFIQFIFCKSFRMIYLGSCKFLCF